MGCMEDLGLPYEASDMAMDELTKTDSPDPASAFVDLDVEFAREYGYGIAYQAEGIAESAEERIAWREEMLAELEPGDIGAYFDQLTACEAEAAFEVTGGHPDGLQSAGAVTAQFYKEILEHPAAMNITRQWTNCMASKGQPFSSPIEARTSVGGLVSQWMNGNEDVGGIDSVLATEKAIAVADAECLAPIRDEYVTIREQTLPEFIDREADRVSEVAGAFSIGQ
jgi:hypothetical protein